MKKFFNLSIIDGYILKRYLVTFSVMLIMFIPIGIVIDVSEKVNRMIEKKVPFFDILVYYGDFIVYFANLLFPIFLFLSVIWFTSKLANNTEIIAILSSGISFTRFLKPYLIGATVISIFALIMGFFIVPSASKGFLDFRYTHLKGTNNKSRETTDIYRQVSNAGNVDEYIYLSNFDFVYQNGYNFVFEKCVDNQLIFKIQANRIKYDQKSKVYTLYGYKKITVGKTNDIVETSINKDMKFNFLPEDLTPVIYAAETMNIVELNKFITKERQRGNSNMDTYLVVLYKKFSLPISAFILTIIAVSVSSMKRRGGMGVNLAIGIVIAFSFIFLDKIFGTLAEKSSIHPFIAVWIPNIVFGILAYYLLKNAKR